MPACDSVEVAQQALQRLRNRNGMARGFGVPLPRYEGERDTLDKWTERKGEAGLAAHVRDRNASSIDGLPGLAPG